MFPEASIAPARAQGGFSLLAAIFLLVILAALAAVIVSVSTTQQVGSAMDLEGARAYQAARAGIEWGVFQSLRNGTCAGANLGFASTTLAGFTATVACASAPPADELGNAVAIDQITATACNQPAGGACPNPAPGQNYVERQLTVTVARP